MEALGWSYDAEVKGGVLLILQSSQFDSQHPHCSLQTSVNPVPEDLKSSSDLWELQACM